MPGDNTFCGFLYLTFSQNCLTNRSNFQRKSTVGTMHFHSTTRQTYLLDAFCYFAFILVIDNCLNQLIVLIQHLEKKVIGHSFSHYCDGQPLL